MRLCDAEYRELIAAASDRLSAVTERGARQNLTTAIRKLTESAERKRQSNAAARRCAIRTGAKS